MVGESFNDKVVVVIGGASGVGNAVALEIAKRGGQVVIADLDEDLCKSVLEHKSGSGPQFFKLNLRNVGECKRLFEYTVAEFGKIDGCFCYAGITSASELIDCDESHFDEMIDINFKGVFFCCKFAVEHMRANGGGSIVLNGSPHAWGGDRDRVVYACSKGAQFPLMKHIAQHYAKDGIRINMVTMGWTPTEGEISLRESQNMSLEELRAWASTIIPAGKMTEVGDLVPGILYLLSDDAKMVSGSNLRITGGWYL